MRSVKKNIGKKAVMNNGRGINFLPNNSLGIKEFIIESFELVRAPLKHFSYDV